MPRRHALLVVALVLLAGCSGASPTGAGDAATTTETTTGTEAGANSETGTSGDTLAPGVTGAGVNASELVAAHRTSVAETGHEYRLALNMTVEAAVEDATLVSNNTKNVRVTGGLTEYRVRSDTRATLRETTTVEERDEWSNGSVRLLRTTQGDRTTYARLSPLGQEGQAERESRLTEWLALRDALAAGNFTVADVSADGSLITLTADEPAPGTQNVSRFTGTVVVDDQGRILRLETHKAGTLEDGRAIAVDTHYRLLETDVDEVARPDWYEQAMASRG